MTSHGMFTLHQMLKVKKARTEKRARMIQRAEWERRNDIIVSVTSKIKEIGKSNLEVILKIWIDVCRLFANTVALYTKN